MFGSLFLSQRLLPICFVVFFQFCGDIIDTQHCVRLRFTDTVRSVPKGSASVHHLIGIQEKAEREEFPLVSGTQDSPCNTCPARHAAVLTVVAMPQLRYSLGPSGQRRAVALKGIN